MALVEEFLIGWREDDSRELSFLSGEERMAVENSFLSGEETVAVENSFLICWREDGSREEFLIGWSEDDSRTEFLIGWREGGSREEFLIGWREGGSREQFLIGWREDCDNVQRKVMWTLFFKHWLFLCSALTRIAQNDCLPHNVYVYFLCGLMCTWIHESVAELICMRFFSDVLTYCVMLQAFIYAIARRQMFMMCARARVCVCVIHWHCWAQLSMLNMEKRYRNEIIIIIIIKDQNRYQSVNQWIG